MFEIIFFASIIIVPFVLTILNLIHLIKTNNKITIFITEFLSIVIGFFFVGGWINIHDIEWVSWNQPILSDHLYPPIDPDRLYQLYIIAGIAFIAWLFLRLCPLDKQPPLAAAFSYSALYLALIELIILYIQVFQKSSGGIVIAFLYPISIILILAKLIKEQISYRIHTPTKESMTGIKKLLSYSVSLPIAGFILLALFIGVLVVVLVLFGQAPDEIIKAWTNTAEWTFSQQTPPPRLPADGHYLCTVAAHGHRKLVKPLRTGNRHGHTILVNRQLLIANAFEDLIKERTPKFHRAVRNFYDTYGLPIAERIRTPWKSDLTYILMKPLEWFFLVILYMFDAKPENRIEVQYMI